MRGSEKGYPHIHGHACVCAHALTHTPHPAALKSPSRRKGSGLCLHCAFHLRGSQLLEKKGVFINPHHPAVRLRPQCSPGEGCLSSALPPDGRPPVPSPMWCFVTPVTVWGGVATASEEDLENKCLGFSVCLFLRDFFFC